MLIGTKYKVETDSQNFILKELKGKKQKEGEDDDDYVNREAGWGIIGYFYDFRELLKFMVDNEIKGTGMNDLLLLNQKQGELYNLIGSLKLLTPSSFHAKTTRVARSMALNA
jgi:hypothetical protein